MREANGGVKPVCDRNGRGAWRATAQETWICKNGSTRGDATGESCPALHCSAVSLKYQRWTSVTVRDYIAAGCGPAHIASQALTCNSIDSRKRAGALLSPTQVPGAAERQHPAAKQAPRAWPPERYSSAKGPRYSYLPKDQPPPKRVSSTRLESQSRALAPATPESIRKRMQRPTRSPVPAYRMHPAQAAATASIPALEISRKRGKITAPHRTVKRF